MDDDFVLSKITEKYPDFTYDKKDSVIKQILLVFLQDNKHMNEVLEFFDMTIYDLFKIIIRKYPYVFSGVYNNKIHKILSRRKYTRRRPSI